jgi:hypothetical protein
MAVFAIMVSGTTMAWAPRSTDTPPVVRFCDVAASKIGAPNIGSAAREVASVPGMNLPHGGHEVGAKDMAAVISPRDTNPGGGLGSHYRPQVTALRLTLVIRRATDSRLPNQWGGVPASERSHGRRSHGRRCLSSFVSDQIVGLV